jgi:hypothetical protein
MTGRTIWERELAWPKSGPLHWLTMYFVGMTFAGFGIWLVLSFISPTAPDPASGKVYEVPAGRRSPPFYVDRFDAYALRIGMGHLVVLATVAGAVGVWNAGARVSKAPD